jgi:glycosyltransferase involved in cell wall biosynthesis
MRSRGRDRSPIGQFPKSQGMPGRVPGPFVRLFARLSAILLHPLSGRRRSQFRRRRLSGHRRTLQEFEPPPRSILDQIKRQAWHEPAVLAPGSEALTRLPQIQAADLSTRDEIDVIGLFAAVGVRPKTVFVVARLDDSDPARYAADLLEALLGGGVGPALVVVTQQTSMEASHGEETARMAPFRAATNLFWPDFCGPTGVRSAVMFGRFLYALRPSHIIIIDSRLGLDAVSIFGRRLSHESKLYCAYFAFNQSSSASGFGAWFPRKTGPFALSLVGSETVAVTFRRVFGSQPGPGIAVLPPRLPVVSDRLFSSRLEARLARLKRSGNGVNWLWISPIAADAGVRVLGRLARLQERRRFDLYGSLHEDLERLGLKLPNVRYCGASPDFAVSDFARYEGFVFTNPSEALPNVVLEMSQQAIPMVVADAGALRETFGDTLFNVCQDTDVAETASRFALALDQVEAMVADEISTRVRAARDRAMSRHSSAAHARAAARIFGLPSTDAA